MRDAALTTMAHAQAPARARPTPHGAVQRGFSLIELMVGLTIGVLCSLLMASVLSNAEGQRRSAAQGMDAQLTGSLGLYAVQRELSIGGYGFASEQNVVGCPLVAYYNGAITTALPSRMVPVSITQGAAGSSDQIRVLSSDKSINTRAATPSLIGFTVPSRVVAPHYNPASTVPAERSTYNVSSSLSVQVGDLLVSSVGAGQPCSLFQATAVAAGSITRGTQAPWNFAGHPAEATADPNARNPQGSILVNLGRVNDVLFRVDGNQNLIESRLDTASMTRSERVLQTNLVLLKALYGRNSDGAPGVDVYDYNQGTTPAEWEQVVTVRLVVVARSMQYEREEVTTTSPLWDVGRAVPVAGAVECGSSRCIVLDLSANPEWKHYRYKVYDTVVPLRNPIW